MQLYGQMKTYQFWYIQASNYEDKAILVQFVTLLTMATAFVFIFQLRFRWRGAIILKSRRIVVRYTVCKLVFGWQYITSYYPSSSCHADLAFRSYILCYWGVMYSCFSMSPHLPGIVGNIRWRMKSEILLPIFPTCCLLLQLPFFLFSLS